MAGMAAEAVAEEFRRLLRQLEVEYENSEAKVTLTRDLQRLVLPGQVLENLRKGAPLQVLRWAARRLVESGVAEPGERVTEQKALLQLEWKEKNNPGELQPAPQYFYLRAREELEEGQALRHRVEDIISLRLHKILSLAAKRVEPSIVENLTKEEEVLFSAVKSIVDEWFKFMAPGGEGR